MNDGFLPTGLLGPGPSVLLPAFVSNGLLDGSSISTLDPEPCASVADTPHTHHGQSIPLSSHNTSRLKDDGMRAVFMSGYIYKMLQHLRRDCHHRRASISVPVQWSFLIGSQMMHSLQSQISWVSNPIISKRNRSLRYVLPPGY